MWSNQFSIIECSTPASDPHKQIIARAIIFLARLKFQKWVFVSELFIQQSHGRCLWASSSYLLEYSYAFNISLLLLFYKQISLTSSYRWIPNTTPEICLYFSAVCSLFQKIFKLSAGKMQKISKEWNPRHEKTKIIKSRHKASPSRFSA